MSTYAQVSDVQALLAGRTIGTTTAPTTTQVSTWIDQAEARANRELTASGLDTIPVTDATAIKLLTDPVASFVAARVLSAKRSQEDMPLDQARIAELVKVWDDWVADVRANGPRWAEMLSQSFSDTPGKSQLRAYQTDRAAADDKSIADGDFDPKFTRDMDW